MSQITLPLVSCIMPTYNRRQFVPCAIRYFLRQEYEPKELIIIDDGTDAIEDLIPDVPFIRYYRLHHKISLGAKLNLACSYASGTVIAHWDDDDWYAPRRITYQVTALLTEEKDLCGINHLLYYDLRTGNAYQYIYPPNQRLWLLGSSLCYVKELWNKNKFADINVGMDGLFVWAASSNRVTVLSDPSISVHMIHDNNISPKKTDGDWWHSYPPEEIYKIITNDWAFYNPTEDAAEPLLKPTQTAVKNNVTAENGKAIKNVYACLVHEHEDCIIDLVRNLHYHDPASVIILYNGGENKELLQQHFPFDKYGAVIHPASKPMTHGYLHHFALDCMQFALDHCSFDALTIVDSDQLSIRSGYSAYLYKPLTSAAGIGMLSSVAEHITKDNTTNYVAAQAYKEHDLWKPLLAAFSGGESKFVHWTFWPSTAFTVDAVRDLNKLFKQNKLLQGIMDKSKIWAMEEVVFPTLVKLLGYEIITNPCSYEYVKYKHAFTPKDAGEALQKPDAFWLHPVPRKYNDAVRTYIREQCNDYIRQNNTEPDEQPAADVVLTLSLLQKIKKIDGWLTDEEADLLIAITQKVFACLSPPHTIVEVGSYHGKTTVLFGSIAKAYHPQAKVYSIDPHDGKQGAVDQGLQYFPPSFDMFTNNIVKEGLWDVVEAIKNKSSDVEWQQPVCLLFIDGLHDYISVAKDFWHFAEWLRPGGYVAFHDYADYFPGVQALVHELLEGDVYKKIGKVESLIILQKLSSV